MHVATVEVIGHHRLALQLLAQVISTGEAARLIGQGPDQIMATAISGGIIAWERASPTDLATLITVIREAVGLVDEDTPTAADLAEAGAEPESIVFPPENPA